MLREDGLSVCPAAEVSSLLDHGLLLREEAVVPPLQPLEQFLARGGPGKEIPPFGPLAWLAERRAEGQGARLPYVAATDLARRVLGGYTREVHPDQLWHDLHVGRLWVKVLHEHAALLPYFLGEDRRKALGHGCGHGEKVPDVIFGHGEEFLLCWEFIGKYPAAKVRALCEQMNARSIPWVLW
jgi:hypothetical protein